MSKKTPKKSAPNASSMHPGSAPSARNKTRTVPPKASAGSPGLSSSPAIDVDDPAPPFRLPSHDGETVSLADFKGAKLVIFFYPRADTPGCTREAIDFAGLADEFEQSGTRVIGISADRPKAQVSFRTKHDLTMPLLSDEAHEVLEAYGVWGEKSMYGRKFFGIVRTTVLIDTAGQIARIWRNVKVDGHADEVLAAARAL